MQGATLTGITLMFDVQSQENGYPLLDIIGGIVFVGSELHCLIHTVLADQRGGVQFVLEERGH
ncbi:MAG: hypothetical protein ABSA69_05850 [Verrucomicrobiota bacterium]